VFTLFNPFSRDFKPKAPLSPYSDFNFFTAKWFSFKDKIQAWPPEAGFSYVHFSLEEPTPNRL
jgi:hypothetical protein